MSRRALIVGAGIGGLAAAVALRKVGWDVSVFEQAPSPRELGFALNLAPNAMDALAELGLAARVRAGGAEIQRVEMRDDRGRLLRLGVLPSSTDASPPSGIVAPRQVVHGALLDATREAGVELVLGAAASGLRAFADAVTLELADGRTAQGDVLIGADGVGSVVRRHLHPAEPGPRASAYLGVRGAVDDGSPLGDLDGIMHLGTGVESAAVRSSPSSIYWYLSLLIRDVDPTERDPREVALAHTRGFDARVRALIAATRPGDLRLDLLVDRAPIAEWGAGPVTLLGDAAHPMLPHAGQGAAQALEDAVALGLALRRGDPRAGLRRYERARSARSRHFVNMSRRIARVTTTRNPLIVWLRNSAIRLMPTSALAGAFVPRNRTDPHRALRGEGEA